MKKQLLLTAVLGLAGASTVLASTVDVYITGSTAFRKNAFTACQKLFVGGNPNVYYGDFLHGVGSSTTGSGAASWAMTGTPITTLTNLTGNTLTIHGTFTGSVQGYKAAITKTPICFALAAGTAGTAGGTSGYVTNTPTIAFSDCAGSSTPYFDNANFTEAQVAVQPFVVCTSRAGTGAVTNVANVSWEQLEYGIQYGRIPASAWSFKASDTNNYVYLLERTQDSGTRNTLLNQQYLGYNGVVGCYLYDVTNNAIYTPTTLNQVNTGVSPNGVVGSEGPGVGGANLSWGYGYIGGGDIASALGAVNAANQTIAYLSFGDSQKVNGSAYWQTVVPFDGFWPTTAGSALTNTGTSSLYNDFSPITKGFYPCWGYEVIVYPTLNTLLHGGYTDQDITTTELGTATTPGSFIWAFNYQTSVNGGSPLVGSIENEIYLSETGSYPNTAIRLAEMVNSRSAVGGQIATPAP